MGMVPGKETITLYFPFTWQGHEMTEIQIRRPKVRDQKAASNISENAVEQEIFMFSQLAEQPIEVIEELDSADYKQMTDTYQRFLDWKPTTPPS